MIESILNYFGLYTRKQYMRELDRFCDSNEYALYLERAVNGMSDPSKPIVVLGSCVHLRDISLAKGQQIIVSRQAKDVIMQNIIYRGE